ncbi:putative stage III sporulation protein AG [Oscillibacter valericigenes Sjm18-20]|nr:putative stage III sporulation protein AG [Oscillibacter valericigenes Sjm18-20]
MKQAETFKKLWDRWKYVVLVVAAGVALLLLPSGGEKSTADTPDENVQDTVQETETRMETILAKIDGVGELHLMLTADTGTARRLAQDTELSYSGDTAAPEDYQRKSETVLSGGSGSEEPVVTETRCPTWRGALVVCQGGGDAQVRLAVTAAVAALTGLGSDRITVVKCQ